MLKAKKLRRKLHHFQHHFQYPRYHTRSIHTPTRPITKKSPPSPNHTSIPSYTIANPTVLPFTRSYTPAGTALYISHVLPDPMATAAGIRTCAVLRNFISLGFQPILATPNRLHASHTKLIDLYTEMGIPVIRIEANDATGRYDDFIIGLCEGKYFSQQMAQIANTNENTTKIYTNDPKLSVVIYDRYTVEELFQLRTTTAVSSISNPQSIVNPSLITAADTLGIPSLITPSDPSIHHKILTMIDTQDIHFLRFARAELIKQLSSCINSIEKMEKVFQNEGNTDLYDNILNILVERKGSLEKHHSQLFSPNIDTIKQGISPFDPNVQRELAAYFRSDLNITVSEQEAQFLQRFGLPAHKTLHLPITYDFSPINNRDITRDTSMNRDQNEVINDSSQLSPSSNLIKPGTFRRRENVIFMGTMKHSPNVDSVTVLRETFVPLLEDTNIRVNANARYDFSEKFLENTDTSENCPNSDVLLEKRKRLFNLQSSKRPNIHIYGTYIPREIHDLTILPSVNDISLLDQMNLLQHQIRSPTSPGKIIDSCPKKAVNKNIDQLGPFVVKGMAKHAIETMGRYKVLLSVLRFGAGVKGKVIDAFNAGTPIIGTLMTAEGLGIGFNGDSVPPHQYEVSMDEKSTENHYEAKMSRCRMHHVTDEHKMKCTAICNELRHALTSTPSQSHDNITATSLNGLLNSAWPGVIHEDPDVITASTLLLNHCECEWQRQADKIPSLLTQFNDDVSTMALKQHLSTHYHFEEIQLPSVGRDDEKSLLLYQAEKVNSALFSLRSTDFYGAMLSKSGAYMQRYIIMKNKYESLIASTNDEETSTNDKKQ